MLKNKIKMINKLLFTLVLVSFFPKSWIRYILDKEVYRFFPSLNPYNFFEIIPFFKGFILTPFKKILPNRESRNRYIPYMFKKILNMKLQNPKK